MSKVTLKTQEKRFPVAPDLYGLFFEDISRAADSGLYPEMLRNRSFEDSILPERCTLSEDGKTFSTPLGWTNQFNNGEGSAGWLEGIPETPIPAWYAENAQMSLDTQDTLNNKRLASLQVNFESGGFIKNIGYRGVPLKKGESYNLYMFAKAKDTSVSIEASVCSSDGTAQDTKTLFIASGEYKRYDCSFTAVQDDFDGCFKISSQEKAEVIFGFISLMPAVTFKGHGMRNDLMEMLKNTNSKFMRFPGGCFVEGFTYETAMRVSNTIGPVWERPSQVNPWGYRTTNGLGYHEFLQMCEDMNLEPMYVFNCGMTCQARSPEIFDDEGVDMLLQEAFDGIEYAIGDASTPMGMKRAQAGHPEPFKMTYVEIGNENHGPDYNVRYKKFYDALKAKYPDIKYIANYHTEEEGLPTEIADEHFYSTPEFFAENIHKYDSYDRSGPEIFVGEYAVTEDEALGSLRCALAESMFMLGIENNQDIVRLSAYAPLFENIHYRSWPINLIRFDNHSAYGIASYHAISMLGANRGDDVIASSFESKKMYKNISGLPGIHSVKDGLQFKNPTFNGKPVSITHEVQGTFTEENGVYTSVSAEIPTLRPADQQRRGFLEMQNNTWAVFGDEDVKEGVFEIQARSADDNYITLAVWCNRTRRRSNDDNVWNMRSVRRYNWTLTPSSSSVYEGSAMRKKPLAEDVNMETNLSEFNTYKVVTREDGFDCYINGKLVHQAYLPHHPAVSSSATTTADGIILKIVNFTGKDDAVDISIDCGVKSGYEADILTAGAPDALNSFETPNAVSASTKTYNNAASEFTYNAPAYSLNILKLKKA